MICTGFARNSWKSPSCPFSAHSRQTGRKPIQCFHRMNNEHLQFGEKLRQFPRKHRDIFFEFPPQIGASGPKCGKKLIRKTHSGRHMNRINSCLPCRDQARFNQVFGNIFGPSETAKTAEIWAVDRRKSRRYSALFSAGYDPVTPISRLQEPASVHSPQTGARSRQRPHPPIFCAVQQSCVRPQMRSQGATAGSPQ